MYSAIASRLHHLAFFALLLHVALGSSAIGYRTSRTTFTCFETPPGTANRSQVVLRVVDHNWLSHHLTASVVKIVLREFLGYTVESVIPLIPVEDLANGVFDIDAENWRIFPGTALYAENVLSSDAQLRDAGAVGYAGRSGVYAFGSVLSAHWSSDYFKFYLNETAVMQAGVSSFNESSMKDDLDAAGVPFPVCDPEVFAWCGSGPFEGFYATPLCRQDPSRCFEVHAVTPAYDTAYFEALARAHEVPAVFAYYGDDIDRVLRLRSRLGKSTVFYRWEPDLLVQSVRAARISFPDYSLGCSQAFTKDAETGDLSCDYGEVRLRKIARSATSEIAPEAYFFFESLQISRLQIDSMMAAVLGGMNASNAACDLVQSNMELFEEFAPKCLSSPPAIVRDGDEVFDAELGGCRNVTVLASRSASLPCGDVFGAADRSHLEVRLVRRGWLSHDLISMLTEVVLRDYLGYKVVLMDTNESSETVLTYMEDGLLDVDMEQWEVESDPLAWEAYSQRGLHIIGTSGYSVTSGLFIQRRALEQHPLADYFKFLSNVTAPSNHVNYVFHGDSWLHEVGANNTALECSWCGTDMKGFWAPNQCSGNPELCMELLHSWPSKDTGYVEQLVQNLGLELVVAYYGDSLVAALERYESQGKLAPFHWWAPDPLIYAVDAIRISFPDFYLGCDAADSRTPEGGVRCDFAERRPVKVVHHKMRDSFGWWEAYYALERMQLATHHLAGLLQDHVSSKGSKSAEELVCDFVQADDSRLPPYNIRDWAPDCITEAVPDAFRVNDSIFSHLTRSCQIVECPPHTIPQTITQDLGYADFRTYICSKCPAMQVPDAKQENCEGCKAGNEVDSAGSSCVPCLPGKYAGFELQQCTPCPVGGAAPAYAQQVCDACPAGQHQNEVGASTCRLCSPGRHSEETGQGECFDCRAGTYQNETGSSGSCLPCAQGTYATSRGSTACEECEFGTTVLLGAASETACQCGTGYYLYLSGSSPRSCRACTEYMEPCPGGDEPPRQRKGFYITQDDLEVFYCLSEDACPGGLLGECPFGAAGPGCAECTAGSFYWDGTRCAECTPASGLVVIAIPVAAVVAFISIHQFGNDPIGKSMTSVAEFLILAGLMLNVLFFMSAFHAIDVAWKEPLSSLLKFMTAISSSEIASLQLTCAMTFGIAGQYACTSAIPILMAMLCFLLVRIGYAEPRKLFNTCGTILYAIFLLMVLHALKPFRYIVHPGGNKTLTSTPFVRQGSEDHIWLSVIGVAVMLLYCASFFTACLWASWAVVKSPSVKTRMWYLESFRFLFFKFQPPAFYWGVVVLMRNTLVGFAPSLWPEHPLVAIFFIAGVCVVSAASTAFLLPWRVPWMTWLEVSVLCYMSLVLNLAAGWTTDDTDISGFLATILVSIAACAVAVVVLMCLRFLWRVAVVGRAGRDWMRQVLTAIETEQISAERSFIGADCDTEVHDFFDAMEQQRSLEKMTSFSKRRPWIEWIASKETDIELVQSIVERIRDENYTAWDFAEDCLRAFPELHLYCLVDGLPDEVASRKNLLACGTTAAEEQQRTLGALLAIYWICRFDMDGKRGLAFGVEEQFGYEPVSVPQNLKPEELQQVPWAKMDRLQRQASFYWDFNWDLLKDLFVEAGILTKLDGKWQVDTAMDGRLVAMLSLTAYHDIMKDASLCPAVRWISYHGFKPGEEIFDHDLALAYVLDRQPELLPSFEMLTEDQRRIVRFTQSEMGFNAGWLVQAEGPPSAVLSKLKQAVVEGKASKEDVAFYFVHWVTDLAGAEPTPFKGSEKFAVKFPPHVLKSLLGCIPIVNELALRTETEVYEAYLARRWEEAASMLGPVPSQSSFDRTARMRLNCMAQQNAKPLLEAFDRMAVEDRQLLSDEMSQTGLLQQEFSGRDGLGGHAKGTPFLLYYGPAWCQRAGQTHPDLCLKVLTDVHRAARVAFAAGGGEPKDFLSCRTVYVGLLKTVDVADLQIRIMENNQSPFQIVVKNNQEAELEAWAMLDV